MNDEERDSERHREVVELLERIARSVERLATVHAPPLARLTRCCPICLGTWEGTLDEPCPRCGGKFAPTPAGGSASCTCGTDDGTCNPKTP